MYMDKQSQDNVRDCYLKDIFHKSQRRPAITASNQVWICDNTRSINLLIKTLWSLMFLDLWMICYLTCFDKWEMTLTWCPLTLIFFFPSSWTWTALRRSCISQLKESQRELTPSTCKGLALLRSSWPSGLPTAQMFRYYTHWSSHSHICKTPY